MGILDNMNIFGSKKPEEDIKASETLEDIVGDFREDLKENEEDIETPPLEDGLLGVQVELEKKDKELREGLAKDGNDWNDVVLKEDRKD